jgi:hypothetical protein
MKIFLVSFAQKFFVLQNKETANGKWLREANIRYLWKNQKRTQPSVLPYLGKFPHFGEILGLSREIFLAVGNIPIWRNFKQANIFDFLCYKPGVSSTRPAGRMWPARCINAAREHLKN